jgi:hypothetical protein
LEKPNYLNEGEILSLLEDGFENLLTAPIPSGDPENITERVNAAVRKFRKLKSSNEDRRDALRDLADVLEFLKKDMKGVFMSNDAKDLFNITNNFGIRHHNTKQKTEYDKTIWQAWIFYCYLATIHLCTRLIEKQKTRQ